MQPETGSTRNSADPDYVAPDDPRLVEIANESIDESLRRLTTPPDDAAAAEGPSAGTATAKGTAGAVGGSGEGSTGDGNTGDGNTGDGNTIAGARDEAFSLMRVMGGWSALLDAGLPGVAFVAAFTLSGQNLRLALIVALALGGVFAVIRLVRKDPLQNVISGFIGVAIAAALANATGKAEDFYLPGLFLNAGYLLLWLITNLARWPLIGVVIGATAGWGFEWRKDPVMLRAFTRVGWVWVGFFALKLAVQVPLYFNKELGAMAVARIAMGWPLWLVVVGLSYIIIKGSVSPDRWASVKAAAEKMGQRNSTPTS